MTILKVLLTSLIITSCAQMPVKKKDIPARVIDITKPGKFQVKSSLSWIKETAECANAVLKSQAFLDEVSAIESFDYSDDNGAQVVAKMLVSQHVLRTYKTKNPFSKVKATTYKRNKRDIYFNRRRNPRALYQMVVTSYHEAGHNNGYGHGDNKAQGKENAVPNKVGAIAGKYAKRLCNPSY
tara:strand:+ start:4129 stop:4674 length:546 start_codon:yes stop_codon:yes gene_type:complete